MRSAKHCAKVRPDFIERLHEVCSARPCGDLIGRPKRNITTEMVEWATGKVGVPKLNTDRLRSTYICRCIENGAGVLDVMTWTGMGKLESLGKYLTHLTTTDPMCPQYFNESGAL